ncbi:LysR family transcriptional regulator, partial [Mesorhizobium sp.]|uniref:LysR family transcriptional regulator n=1 Tax=Mesorhizobium sp. TaxID=1871066 RepID=UPI0011F81BD4
MEPASLQGVLAFVQTVEAGSFTGAGRRLHVTKSAVGKAVAQLEQRLGVRLLNRTTRSLSPTSEGLGYYEACVRALSEIEAAQSLLAERRLVPSGRLRVDVPLAFGRRCVAPVLFDISRQFPDLTIEISFNDRRVDLIEEGIDLAVRMGDLDDSLSLAARRIYAQRSAICAAPSYLEKHGRPRSIDDLASHSVIGYGRDGIVRPWSVRHADGHIEKFTPR